MKRRTMKAKRRDQRKQNRLTRMYRAGNNSKYATKVQEGQMYGPAPTIPIFPQFQIGDALKRGADHRRDIDRPKPRREDYMRAAA